MFSSHFSVLLRNLLGSIAILLMGSGSLLAQSNYPNRPVKLIVPFPAGQATDIAARMLGEGLAKIWGQQVVIENKTGVPGMLAGRDALPDGYTLTMGSSGTLAVNPGVYNKLPYEGAKDYVLINETLKPLTELLPPPHYVIIPSLRPRPDFPAESATRARRPTQDPSREWPAISAIRMRPGLAPRRPRCCETTTR